MAQTSPPTEYKTKEILTFNKKTYDKIKFEFLLQHHKYSSKIIIS